MKKKRFPLVIIILIFTLGVAVMLYPFISNWWNQRKQDVEINDYTAAIEQMNQEELDAERVACEEYNEELLGNVVLTDPFDPEKRDTSEEYEARININKDRVMGYIEIPAIDVKLAIYHGTDSEVLKTGVGHLENTSLPVGGIASHAVLSAHTGLPGATLFTDLIDLKKGELFYLNVLGEKLAYEIDQIKVVEPSDTNDLVIDREEDYVTLATCTPYGVNSHRLLVRGTRVPYMEDAVEQPVAKANLYLYVTIILMLVLAIIIIRLIILRIKGKQQHEE